MYYGNVEKNEFTETSDQFLKLVSFPTDHSTCQTTLLLSTEFTCTQTHWKMICSPAKVELKKLAEQNVKLVLLAVSIPAAVPDMRMFCECVCAWQLPAALQSIKLITYRIFIFRQ
ncbi:hypothetical protein Tsp_01234 [Trichinella spiralis]|uniref:hypothetical protein n=1 Tax=Trichinella spiralis TaxID=6334 RepID=UPI0001EFCA45|nr:hypothetical protein Tsp_01234 [Trichinella spiralis]